MRYYHYIVEDKFNGKRSEIVKAGTLRDTPKYKVIGCCGYHEKPTKKRSVKE